MSKWELSGNGSGQRAEGDKHFGHVSSNQSWLRSGDNEFMDGKNRQFFFTRRKILHIMFLENL